MDVVIKMNDFHVPFHDIKAINVALKYVKSVQPKILIVDEIIDFYSISKYDKDPRRKLDLQLDLDESIRILKLIRRKLPNTRIIMVKSNHDARLQKYLRSKAPELSGLRVLQLSKLLQLDKLEIAYKDIFVFRNVLFKHGSIVRQDSSYTAKAEFMREGMSGASGHTHRLGVYFKTLRGGKYVWIEGGCLCICENIEYIDGTANWQQGLAKFSFKTNDRRFYPAAIPIIDHKILWGGKIFQ